MVKYQIDESDEMMIHEKVSVFEKELEELLETMLVKRNIIL